MKDIESSLKRIEMVTISAYSVPSVDGDVDAGDDALGPTSSSKYSYLERFMNLFRQSNENMHIEDVIISSDDHGAGSIPSIDQVRDTTDEHDEEDSSNVVWVAT